MTKKAHAGIIGRRGLTVHLNTTHYMHTAIHWFRRDLRLSDNTALAAACARAGRVIPVFILEASVTTGRDVGAARLEFLLRSVEALRKALHQQGQTLITRFGSSAELIPELARELGAQAVFANKRYEPYARARDGKIFATLNALGIGFELFKDAVVWEETEVLTGGGKPYVVFGPYAKAWQARRLPGVVATNPWPASSTASQLQSTPLPASSAELGHPLSHPIPPAGEVVASAALDQFLEQRVHNYHTARDFPAVPGTSQLSPHLRVGAISPRTILARTRALASIDPEAAQGAAIFVKELVWRDFYTQILTNFPHVMRQSFYKDFDRLEWADDPKLLQAWKDGATGFPIVDAAMRCLAQTGWMHNRLRMITAMFLTKDLLVDWRVGELHFMRTLIDGDMAANNGGWQWAAGTGTDAAPYFRIFNPVTQGLKFDPDGAFVRQWVPELRHLKGEAIHEPWKSASGSYPTPIVDHKLQRIKALDMYKAIRPKPLLK